MSGTTTLKFCIQCGDKHVKEMTKQLDQLFNIRELQAGKCGLCHELITDESKALLVTESFTQSPQKGVSLREHDILEQSGVTLTSKGDQSIIPVLLNVIRQLGKSVVHITHQHGESGGLDSFVTLTDLVTDDQKDGGSLKPSKTSDSKDTGGPEVLHKNQENIQGDNTPASQTHNVNENASEAHGDLSYESDDDIGDQLPNDWHTDSVEKKYVPQAQENLISQESQLTNVPASKELAIRGDQTRVKRRRETNASSINQAFSTDIDECDLKDILDPQVFDILNLTSDGYAVCKHCPFQCVTTGLGIRKALQHTTQHSNLPVIEKPYQCPRCGFKANVRIRLAAHMTSCGTKEKPFKCPICKKGFFSLCSLGVHIRSGRHGNKGRPRKNVVKKRGKRGRPRKYPVVEKKRGKRGRPRKNAQEEENIESSFNDSQKQVQNKGKKRKWDGIKEEPVYDTKRQRACNIDESRSVHADKGKKDLATSPSDNRVEKTADENISQDEQVTSRKSNAKLKQTSNVLKSLSASQLKVTASPCFPIYLRKSKTNKDGKHGSKSSKETKKTSEFIDDLQSVLDTRVLDMIHPKSDSTNCIVCKVCFEPFLTHGHSLYKFLTHISEHNKTPCIEEPYVCRATPDCQLSFKSKASLRTHFEKLHRDEESYKCHVCGKKYAIKNSYLKHMSSVHSGVQVEDNIVDGEEVFVKADVSDLSVVLDKQILDMVHQDCDFASSLVCKVCKDTFRSSVIGVKHFTSHICDHKGIDVIDKPYNCPDGECSQNFSSPRDLKSHYTNEHSTKNTKKNASLRCLHCPEFFDSIEVLKKHVSVHLENDWDDVSARMRINEDEETDHVDFAITITEAEPDVDNEQEEEQNESDEASHVSETEKTFNDDLSVILVANLKAMVHEECNMKESIVCKECSLSFQTGERSIRQFAKHVAEHIGEPAISAVYQCSDCPELFRGLFMLESHWITAHDADEDEDRVMERIGSDASDDEDVDGEKLSEGESSDDAISDEEGVKEIENAKLEDKEKEQVTEYADADVNKEAQTVHQESPADPNSQSSKEQEDQNGSPGDQEFQEGQDVSPGEPNFPNLNEQEGQDESSGEPKFLSSKLATDLIPEVLEAVHKDCDLKKVIMCKYCLQMFTNGGHGMAYFLKHIVKHTGKPVIVKPYLCSECGDTFKRSFELYQHTISRHRLDKIHKCQHCGKSYNKRNSLYKHLRDIHRTTVASKEIYVMCELCGKEVKKSNLKNHASVHTGEFELHCDIPGCTYKTNYKKYLNQHMAHAHKPRSDLCRFCGLSFPLQGALAAHEQRHINNEPNIFKKHRCSECGFSADKISDLAKHERRHKKEFRFKCTDCDQKFVGRKACRRHIPYCQKKRGLPVTAAPVPIDLFVRKRRSKYDQIDRSLSEPAPAFPEAVEQMKEEFAAEETVTFTVASLDNIPVTTIETASSPAVEIATAIANLQYMQS